MNIFSIKEITDDIKERMDKYTLSMAPTDDECRIAYMVSQYDLLKKITDELASALSNSLVEYDEDGSHGCVIDSDCLNTGVCKYGGFCWEAVALLEYKRYIEENN